MVYLNDDENTLSTFVDNFDFSKELGLANDDSVQPALPYDLCQVCRVLVKSAGVLDVCMIG